MQPRNNKTTLLVIICFLTILSLYKNLHNTSTILNFYDGSSSTKNDQVVVVDSFNLAKWNTNISDFLLVHDREEEDKEEEDKEEETVTAEDDYYQGKEQNGPRYNDDHDGIGNDIDKNNHENDKKISNTSSENTELKSSFLIETNSIFSSNHKNNSSSSSGTILSDITNITHIPSQRLIIIYFKEPSTSTIHNLNLSKRQCLNPIVRGRLSGPLLSIIDFQEQRGEKMDNPLLSSLQENITTSAIDDIDHGDQDDQIRIEHYTQALVGTYNVPLSGMYYLEIIGILCNHKFDIPNHNFKNTCLINPVEHRLTASNASIHVDLKNGDGYSDGDNNNTHMSTLGYWKRKKQLDADHQTHHVPLYTRYQPTNCRSDEEKGTSRCKDATNMTRFDPYEFEFSPLWQQALKRSTQRYSKKAINDQSSSTINNNDEGPMDSSSSSHHHNHKNQNLTICVIGWSHARNLVQSMRDVVSVHYFGTKEIEIPWIKAKYPHDLHDINFFHNIHAQYKDYSSNNCTHVIVGLGQWPGYQPMLFDEYERDMKSAIDVMKKAREELGFKLFLRSIHYNPLGDFYSLCPPKDWRYPPVIEGYNRIIEKLSNGNNITYISTDDIVGPMWDSANDWCHLTHSVGMVEAFYMLGLLLLTNNE